MMLERRSASTPMEAFMLRRSMDPLISPHKSQIRNPKINNNQFFFHENLVPSNAQNMGLLQIPPPPLLSHSYPPYSIQPPLLPLPTTDLRHISAAGRGLSYPPTSRKTQNNNRARDPSLTTIKSKSPKKAPTKEVKSSTKRSSESVVVPSNSPFGPDPKDLPKEVTKFLPLATSTDANKSSSCLKKEVAEDNRLDMFSGPVLFTISPPPSSLPLPTFSLRPKLSCNAQAAGIDTGATDNLRRLLRLR